MLLTIINFKGNVKLDQLIAGFYEVGKIACLICHDTSLLLWTKLSGVAILTDVRTCTGFTDNEEALSLNF